MNEKTNFKTIILIIFLSNILSLFIYFSINKTYQNYKVDQANEEFLQHTEEVKKMIDSTYQTKEEQDAFTNELIDAIESDGTSENNTIMLLNSNEQFLLFTTWIPKEDTV